MNLYFVNYKKDYHIITIAKNGEEAKNKLYRKRLASLIKLVRSYYFKYKEEPYHRGYVFPVQFSQLYDKRTRLNSEVCFARWEAKLEKEKYSIKRIHQIDDYKIKLEKVRK
jgi:hypothetical protein